jgi:hypothetical protein
MRAIILSAVLLVSPALAVDFDDGIFVGSVHALHRPSGPGFKIDISWRDPESSVSKENTDRRQALLDHIIEHLDRGLAAENLCNDGYTLDSMQKAANDDLVIWLGYCN